MANAQSSGRASSGGAAAVDWNAAQYAKHSSLQAAMAAETLALLKFRGDERVLDVGCGDGRITAGIADLVPRGSVLGVDPSADMIAHASGLFGSGGTQARPNLRFEIADARSLPYHAEFDVLVSFNALHWVPEQTLALQGIRAALKPTGRAQFRLVTKGAATSLEEVAEATRRLPRWAPHFEGFTDPYLRLTPEQYAALAQSEGLHVRDLETHARAWNFQTHDAFSGFCNAGFGAWTLRLPVPVRGAFVEDVMTRYLAAVSTGAEDAFTFRFDQTDVALALSASPS